VSSFAEDTLEDLERRDTGPRGTRRRWPRLPDQLTSLAVSTDARLSTGGQPIALGDGCTHERGVMIPLGDFTGVQFSPDAGANWADLKPGFPLPVFSGQGPYFRKQSPNGGTLELYYWALHGDESLEAISALAEMLHAGADSKSSRNVATASQGRITPAAAGTQVTPSDSTVTEMRVFVDQTNANPIVIAETQAKAALLLAAGGGVPGYPTAIITIPCKSGQVWLASSTGTELCYVLENKGN